MDNPYQYKTQLKESLRKAIDKSIFSYETKLGDWLRIMMDKYDSQLPINSLLSALEAKHGSLNAKATEWLSLRLKEDYEKKPLQKGAVLTTIGTLHFNKNDLKRSLKSGGIVYSTKMDDSVTHVLLGYRLKEEAGLIVEQSLEKYVFMTEAMFLEFQKQLPDTFLIGEDAKDAQIAHISQLLLHSDETNVELALSLLKSGGVPRTLITELFIVYRFAKDNKLSNQAQKLLKLHASVALQELMPKLKRNWWSLQYEDWLKQTELEDWKIYQYAYLSEPTNHNLLRKAIDTTPREAMDSFLHQAMEKWALYGEPESIAIPDELDFETHKNLIYSQEGLKFIYIATRTQQRIKTLPEGISRLKNLEKLTIKTALNSFPKELQLLPKLKYLDINVLSIRDFKGVFDKGFQKLETLIMRQLRINDLPFGIGNLTNLTYLDLQGGDISSLPADFRALTNLQELNLNNNKFNQVPDVLFLMPQLKKLLFSGYWPEREIRNLEALRDALPDTKVIF